MKSYLIPQTSLMDLGAERLMQDYNVSVDTNTTFTPTPPPSTGNDH